MSSPLYITSLGHTAFSLLHSHKVPKSGPRWTLSYKAKNLSNEFQSENNCQTYLYRWHLSKCNNHTSQCGFSPLFFNILLHSFLQLCCKWNWVYTGVFLSHRTVYHGLILHYQWSYLTFENNFRLVVDKLLLVCVTALSACVIILWDCYMEFLQ